MNRKMLFVFRDGVILKDFQYGDGTGFSRCPVFEPGVITSLSMICSSDEYSLVLIVPAGQHDALSRVHDSMLCILKDEGIEFGDTCTEHDLSAFKGKEHFSSEKSLLIGRDEQQIRKAGELSCRALLYGTDESFTGEKPDRFIGFASSWNQAASLILGDESVLPPRRAEIARKTSETDIAVSVNLDGSGSADISTGLGFLDHMLHQLARHGKIDLQVKASGDLEVDEHHTIEDTAIVLGQVFLKALGDKRGISRYGFLLPMDDALAQAAVDFSGRPWLLWDVSLHREYVGDVPADMIFHFFKSFSDEAKCNLSLKAEGSNDHHTVEALFKAFARAVRMAVRRDPLDMALPSTKGAL